MDFHQLLTECVKRSASDLHLKSGSRPIVRVHGHLETQDDLPAVTRDFMRKTAMTLLGEIRYNALMEGEEMDLAHTVPSIGRFRINVFLCQGDVRAVLRHIPERIPAFEELHLPKVLERLCLERRGMVLVTGITGSGKSTTLAAMLDFMNRTRNDHIVTIEDPVEFVHEDKKCVISQREIGQDSTSFAQALRAALRQDPDIILVGEMRDAETMEVALHAAETGHLVLSTLHTLNATETINRIISIFPPPRPALRRHPGRGLPAPGGPRRRQGAGARGRGHDDDRPRSRVHPREAQDAPDPYRHRLWAGAVRHADFRPVAAGPLPRGARDLRDGAGRRDQPGRLRPQGEGHLLDR